MFVGSRGRHWVKCAQLLSVFFGLLLVPAFAQNETTSKGEVFGGYSYFHPGGRFLPTDLTQAKTMSGWGLSAYTPFSRRSGAVVDVSGSYGGGNSLHSVMFGAEFKFRMKSIEPFGEGMLGWIRRSPKGSESVGTASFLGGGGLDIPINNRIAIRAFRADYIFSFSNPARSASTDTQTFWNSLRVQSGVVVKFGTSPVEEQIATVACLATPEKVNAGEPVAAKAVPNGFAHKKQLTYEWQLKEAKLSSTAANAVIETASLAPGDYTITAKASDRVNGKRHHQARCSATFAVLALPAPEVPASSAAATTVESQAKPEATAATDTTAVPTEAPPHQAVAEATHAPRDEKNSATPEAQQASGKSATAETVNAAKPETESATKSEIPKSAAATAPQATPSSKRSKKGKTPAQRTSVQAVAKQPEANQSPMRLTVSATPVAVASGDPVKIAVSKPTADNSAPAPICRTSIGTLHAENGEYILDTVGVPAGKISVTCTDCDGRPLGSTLIKVTAGSKSKAPARILNSVAFNNTRRPARVDNVAKQILRDAAHALQQSEPGSKLILVGNARAIELEANKDLATQRATNAKAFLMDKQNGGGVDASSIAVQVGKADARRVDIYLAGPGHASVVAAGADHGTSGGKAANKVLKHRRRGMK